MSVVTDLYQSIKEILTRMQAAAVAVVAETPAPAAPPAAAPPAADPRGRSSARAGAEPAPEPEAEREATRETQVAQVGDAAPAAVAPPAPAPEPAPRVAYDAPDAPVQSNWRKQYYRRVIRKRGLALFLDYLLLFFVPVFVIAATPIGEDTLGYVMVALGFVVFYVLAPAFEASGWRATPGKRIVKLQITTKDAERISYRRAFASERPENADALLVLPRDPADLPVHPVRQDQELFHDEVSSTVIGERLASIGPAPAATLAERAT